MNGEYYTSSKRIQAERKIYAINQYLVYGIPVSIIARILGVSRQTVYNWINKYKKSLADKKPGRPSTSKNEVNELRLKNRELLNKNKRLHEFIKILRDKLSRSVEITAEKIISFVLEGHSSAISYRAVRKLFSIMDKGTNNLSQQLQTDISNFFGKISSVMMDTIRKEVSKNINAAAADEIFFHDKPILALLESISGALLSIEPVRQRDEETWVCCLSDYHHLKYVISDLAKGITSAADKLNLTHCADYMHELYYFFRTLIRKMDKKCEHALQEEDDALDRATRPDGRGRRLSVESYYKKVAYCNKMLEQYELVLQTFDLFKQVCNPIDPKTGRVQTEREGLEKIVKARQLLLLVKNKAAHKVARHLYTNRFRFVGYLKAFDEIKVKLSEGSSWNKRAVLNAILKMWNWEKESMNDCNNEYMRNERVIRALEKRVSENCLNLNEVKLSLKRALKYLYRSSSIVESINSRLRVLQMVKKKVSRESLSLMAVAYNLTPRAHKNKRGNQSPYKILGVSFADDKKPWYQILLEFAKKNGWGKSLGIKIPKSLQKFIPFEEHNKKKFSVSLSSYLDDKELCFI